MSDSSSSSDIAKAIPVERDTLRKVRVEIMDLPEAHSPKVDAPKESSPKESSPKIEASSAQPKVKEFKKAEVTAPVGEKNLLKSDSINRKALDSTNRGKSPDSRRFVRGILHPSPGKMFFAAFFAILVRLALLAFIVLMSLIVLDQVDLRATWFALILPVAALFHVATMGQARCRVCGLKEFVPSRAHKHRQSHQLLFFGPIVSTALHLILFRWFRCMFCGTPIRIRK